MLLFRIYSAVVCLYPMQSPVQSLSVCPCIELLMPFRGSPDKVLKRVEVSCVSPWCEESLYLELIGR